MIGIIVALIFSWLLLHLADKKNLSVLGFYPTKNRMVALIAGFLIAAATCTIYHMAVAFSAGARWALSSNFNTQAALASCWWTLKSVLFEELVFRGALLYIAVEKLGVRLACILSAVCFGIYHWFSYNALGSPVQMIIILLVTGFFGFALANAFARTKSLYLPFAVHFGWNLFHIVVFSSGPLGAQMFVRMNGNKLTGILSLVLFLFQALAVPVLTLLYTRHLSNRLSLFTKN